MNSKLHKAIERGDLRETIAALENGADIEATDMHGASGLPLRTACFKGHTTIVRELIQRGANIHAANADGSGAAIRMAARGKHWNIIQLLISHGAEKPADIELPAAEPGERRQRRERRGNNYGPPKGLRERRSTPERRVTFVQEVELSDHQWTSYFSNIQARQVQHPEFDESVSQVFERVRD